MEYKEEIKNLIYGIEEVFSDKTFRHQKWTKGEQDILNEKLTLIAEEMGVFATTAKNEEKNIQKELTITDENTGEKIELVNKANMKQRVKDVLKTNDFFSILRCVAISNKCAHKCDNNYDGLQKKISNIRSQRELYSNSIANTINFNIESYSKTDIDELMEALGRINVARGTIISICRKLGVDITDIKANEEELNKLFYQLKSQRGLILDKYEELLMKKAEIELSCRESLFWIKDQLIVMIGQLLVEDSEYQKLNYEMVECGENPDFKNMLVIDYDELSYYIEVHMPNYISEELIQEYKLKSPVESHNRTFEELGATAVYNRDDLEVQRIRQESLNNVRSKILARPKRKKSTSSNYEFKTKKVQQKKDVGIYEKKERKDSGVKIIPYSKMRSDEKQIDIEERIVADCIDEIFRKRDALEELNENLKDKFIEEIKSFARQEVIRGDKFEKVYYMYANDKSENELIKLIGYEKEISNIYKSQDRNYNIVEMIEFIKREVPKYEEKIEKYRKYNKEKGEKSDGKGNDGR